MNDMTKNPSLEPTDPLDFYDPDRNWLALWDPGAVAEGQGLPRVYLHDYCGPNRPFNPDDHLPLFESRALLYTYWWTVGHAFSDFDSLPKGVAKLTQPAWLDRQKWSDSVNRLQQLGYIEISKRGDMYFAKLTNKLRLSDSPSVRPEHDFCLELNRRYFSLFYGVRDVLDMIVWFGLHRRVSNGLLYLEFSATAIPGYVEHYVRQAFQLLCNAHLLKQLRGEQLELVDARPLRKPHGNRYSVNRGTVALIRNCPFTCVPTTAFPRPRPDIPSLRFIQRPKGNEPLIVQYDPAVRYVRDKHGEPQALPVDSAN